MSYTKDIRCNSSFSRVGNTSSYCQTLKTGSKQQSPYRVRSCSMQMLFTNQNNPFSIKPLFNWPWAVGSVLSGATLQNQISLSKIKCLLAAINGPRAARGMNVEDFRTKKARLEQTMLIRFQAGPTQKSRDTEAFQTQNDEWNVNSKQQYNKRNFSNSSFCGINYSYFFNQRNKYFRAQILTIKTFKLSL